MISDFRSIQFPHTIPSDKRKFSKVKIIDRSNESSQDSETASPEDTDQPFCNACRITDPELKGSFTRGGYVTYLCTLQLNDGTTHSIRKRYSEFSPLRAAIQAAKPGVYLPHLPPKSYTQRTAEAFLDSRRNRLELFLRSVLLNPEVGGISCVREWVNV